MSNENETALVVAKKKIRFWKIVRNVGSALGAVGAVVLMVVSRGKVRR